MLSAIREGAREAGDKTLKSQRAAAAGKGEADTTGAAAAVRQQGKQQEDGYESDLSELSDGPFGEQQQQQQQELADEAAGQGSVRSVLDALSGLPAFPDRAENHLDEAALDNATETANASASASAAGQPSGGPCRLIREVLLAPFPHAEAPAQLYADFERARLLETQGQHEQCIELLAQCLDTWTRPHTWRPPDVEAQQRRLEARQARAQDRLEAELARQQAEEEDRERNAQQAAEQKILDDLAKDVAGGGGGGGGSSGAAAKGEASLVSEDEVSRQRLNEQRLAEAGQLSESDGEDEANEPQVTAFQDLEHQIYIWNCIGGVYETMAQDDRALTNYWNAQLLTWAVLNDEDESARARGGSNGAAKNGDDADEDGDDGEARAGPDDDDLSGLRDVTARQNAQYRGQGDGDGAAADEGQTGDDEDDEADSRAGSRRGDGNGVATSSRQPRLLNPRLYASPVTAVTFSNLGSACLHLNEPDLALRCYFASLNIRTQTIDPDSYEFVDVGNSLNNIGVCLYALGRTDEAYEYFLSAEELYSRLIDRVHPRLNAVRLNLQRCQQRRSRLTLKTESLVGVDVSLLYAKHEFGMPVDHLTLKRNQAHAQKMPLRGFRVTHTELTKLVEKANAKKKKKKKVMVKKQ